MEKVLGQLSKEELSLIQSHYMKINERKFRYADLGTMQIETLHELQELKQGLQVLEQKLLKQYGENSVIDIRTGEVREVKSASVLPN